MRLLRWSNGFFAPGLPNSLDTSVLPADNDYTRCSVNGNLRQLPWGTTLAGRYTYSKLKNDVEMPLTMLAAEAAKRSGLTEMPWPKAMVAVSMVPQLAG